MKRTLAALLALTLLAAACGDDDAAADGAVPDDGDAAPDDLPQRVVSLSATATESLFALGAGDQLVAVDNFSTYPANDLPQIDSFAPSIEGISEFEPDLVVLSFDPGGLVDGLEALGIDTLTQPTAASLDDAYAQIEQLGAATGHIAEAAEVVLQIQTDLASVVADAPDGTGVTYFHELGAELYSLTSSTFAGEIYGLFGMENIADPADADGFGYPQLVEEFVIDADPDLIFLADTVCCAQDASTVAARPGWSSLRAVTGGGVVELDDDVASRWGPRLVEFAAAIAGALETVVAPA